jgi:hypothetical protein
VLENGVDDSSRILEKLVLTSAVNVLEYPLDILIALATGIRIRWAPLLSFRRKDASICDGGEVGIVTTGLQQDHIGVHGDVIKLNVALVGLIYDLFPACTGAGLEVEVLVAAIGNPAVVSAHPHRVRLAGAHIVVLVGIVIRTSQETIGYTTL